MEPRLNAAKLAASFPVRYVTRISNKKILYWIFREIGMLFHYGKRILLPYEITCCFSG